MACTPLTIKDVTPAQFEALVSKAALQGLKLNGTFGTVELHGCTFLWAYDGSAVTIQCTAKPLLFGCDAVNEKIQALLK